MPIHLSWTPPVEVGSGIVLYKIYKTINPGPLVRSDLFATADGNDTTYDDYVYDRRILMEDGYLYKITALTDESESSFSGANLVLVTYSFEDYLATEEWEFGFTGSEELELFEDWEIEIPTSPDLLYDEEWEHSLIPELQYDEEWDAPFIYIGSGGLITGGLGATSHTALFTYIGSGSLVTGGIAATSHTVVFTYTGTGNIVTGGVGATSYTAAAEECSVADTGGSAYLEFN